MMKTLAYLFSAVILLGVTSCSKHHEQAFHKRKYMPWFAKQKVDHKHEPQVSSLVSHAQLLSEEPIPEKQLAEVSEAVSVRPPQKEQRRQLRTDATPAKMVLAPEKMEAPQPSSETAEAVSELHGGSEVSRQDEVSRLSSDELRYAPKPAQQSESMADDGIRLLLLVIVAILLPPLAVAIVDGISLSFLLSIVLTILGYIPGLIYAIFRVLR